jgi:hypothetical protein
MVIYMCADYCLHNFSYIADKGCGLAIVNYLQLTQTRTVSDFSKLKILRSTKTFPQKTNNQSAGWMTASGSQYTIFTNYN